MTMYRVLAAVVTACLLAPKGADAVLTGPSDLEQHYDEIFPTGNRNAASHKWVSFILRQSNAMSPVNLKNTFKGFCAVSGSPIPDSPRTLYKVRLPKVAGGSMDGITHHCCWPCVCDTRDFLQVDTKTIQTSEGPKQYNMLVLGDPCKFPDKLNQQFTDPFNGAKTSLGTDAPELSCTADGKLEGAEYSDHGFPIVGLFFTDQEDAAGLVAPPGKALPNDDTFGYGQMCEDRKEHGYNSGMGLIFHLLANINPLPKDTSKPLRLYTSLRTDSLGASPSSHSGVQKGSMLSLLSGCVVVALAAAALGLWLHKMRSPETVGVQMIDYLNTRCHSIAE